MDTFKTLDYDHMINNPSMNFTNMVLVTEKIEQGFKAKKNVNKINNAQKKPLVTKKKEREVHQIDSRPYQAQNT